MKRALRNLLKKIFLASLFWNYKFLIKSLSNGKTSIPKNYVDDVYEIYSNYDTQDDYFKKIVLPYEAVDNVNRNNINKPYEIVEIIEVNSQKKQKITFAPTRSCLLPLSLLNKKGDAEKNATVTLSFGNKTVNLVLKYTNRFHYLPIVNEESFSKIEVECSDCDLVIGRPILKDKPLLPGKPKLVVQIFIDALTQCMIEKFGMDIMPNTKRIFSSGSTHFKNTYAQSEWTLSSMAGILTGKYTNDHLIFHPRRPDKVRTDTIASTLRQDGYTTFACTNIPKLSPINGFDKGFDRYILANDKDCNYLINEAIEQLESFSGNQFLFLGLFDVHESHTLQPLSTQASCKLEDFQFQPLKGNSKNTKVAYDNERVGIYKESIRHLDKKLNNLYQAIENYDANAMIVLHSDHGVNFMGHTEELLSREREKVIFLYKDNKEQQDNNSIKEIRHLYSMLCNDLNIGTYQNEENRGLSITESLFPNKDYEIAVRDDSNVLFYKVSWEDLLNKNVNTFIPKISYHPLDNEVKIVNSQDVDPRLELAAKQHYINLIRNLDINGETVL